LVNLKIDQYDTRPIIVSGMHRSGTTLLSNILLRYGVFMGSKNDTNVESLYFQRINRWLLSCLGSSWNNPKSFNSLSDDDMMILTDRIMKSLNSSGNNYLYFGFKKKLLGYNFSSINNWGWKDPSNTFTLPVWLNIFPKAKIIFIIRHPLDIALSLIDREHKLKKADLQHRKEFLSLSKYIPVLSIAKGDVLSVFNLQSINDCIKLTNRYYEEIYLLSKNNTNILIIKYEDLVLNTNKIIDDISNYIERNVTNNIIDSICDSIISDKAYFYKNINKIVFDNKLLFNNKFYADD